LLLFACHGFKIDENLLRKIQLDTKEYDSLTLNSTYVISNLIESNVFENIKLFEINVVDLLKKRVDEISAK
jgi:hypothetical protein